MWPIRSRTASARRRIREAGGCLAIWAVLHEDVYETAFGDGFYLHLCGIALNDEDAHRLVALDQPLPQFSRWHVRPYRLRLDGGAPAFDQPLEKQEEFTIDDVVRILDEIPPGGTTSFLQTDQATSDRRPGPGLLALAKG
jgi:hypothetical protein